MMNSKTNRLKAWRFAAFCMLTCLVPAAQAAGIDDFQIHLSDVQLNDLRGRFAQGGEVVYFGVAMQTQWQLADGSSVNAGLDLTLANGDRPKVTLAVETGKGPGAAAASPDAVHIHADGLSNIQGVRQSIQIGGNGNHVTNDVNIDVAWKSAPSPVTPAASKGAADIPIGVLVLANGAQTQAAAGPGGLSLDIKAPGQGEVLQQLKSGTGITQSVMLSSDLNQIHNTFNITAQFQPAHGVTAASMAHLLDTLKGLP